MTRVYNKTQQQGHFFRLPIKLRHYIFLDGYKEEMNYLYGLIVDKYNVGKGYAFPSQYTLAKDYGKSQKTVEKHIAKLEEVGLLQVRRNGLGKVNHYRPLEPLTQDELFAKYPKAAENYDKVTKAKALLASNDWDRLPIEDKTDVDFDSIDW